MRSLISSFISSFIPSFLLGALASVAEAPISISMAPPTAARKRQILTFAIGHGGTEAARDAARPGKRQADLPDGVPALRAMFSELAERAACGVP